MTTLKPTRRRTLAAEEGHPVSYLNELALKHDKIELTRITRMRLTNQGRCALGDGVTPLGD